jgi:membrane fusion protein, heavy metal efflux system
MTRAMANVITRKIISLCSLLPVVPFLLATSCSDPSKAAPTKAEITLDPNVFTVEHPELFAQTKVAVRELPLQLTANGTVNPDITRTIHVTSLGSGRITDLRVRLGDQVRKGQVLLLISSPDLASAMADYQKFRADENLSRKALERAQMLYSHGALAQKDLEIAQDTEDKAKVDLETAERHVRVLGGDPAHPGPLIELRAPISGTIVEQNVAGFESVKSLDNSPSLFTIADLSEVWVVCDVYENNLGEVHLGDSARVRINAFSDRIFQGKVSDISHVLDPTTRAAKVRIALRNADGALRPGMFAVATFRSRRARSRLVMPATAIMRLQDKDWVFRKEGPQRFRRIEVENLGTTSDGLEEVQGSLKADDEVIANALEFSTAVTEQGR